MDKTIITKTTQAGRSMIEILSVLAIIGILSVGGIFAYSRAMQKQKINRIHQQISQVVMNVRTHYLSQDGYDNLTTESAIESGIIPDDMKIEDVVGSDGRITKHIFNGEFLVEAKIDPVDGQPLFMVILSGLPKDAAMELSTSNWDKDEGLVQIDLVNSSKSNEDEEEN